MFISISLQSICAVLYMVISIHLTDNDSDENFRVYYFLMFAILATLSAQAWGFFVGATLPIKVIFLSHFTFIFKFLILFYGLLQLAVFLGPILAVLFSVFGFCTRYIDITPLFRWMWHISYFRAGFHGALNSIYGMDRPFLPCPENTMYCHFRSPKVFLSYMMISDVNITHCIVLMVSIIGVMHVLTVLRLWHKLNKR